jgi:hypothetical protein
LGVKYDPCCPEMCHMELGGKILGTSDLEVSTLYECSHHISGR